MNDGGPAFPTSRAEKITDAPGDWADVEYPGMSLRDWFAGMALRSMRVGGDAINMPGAAEWCYAFADAMLAERAKGADDGTSA